MKRRLKAMVSQLCALALVLTLFASPVTVSAADAVAEWDILNDDFAAKHYTEYNYAVSKSGGEITHDPADGFLRVTDNSWMGYLGAVRKQASDPTKNWVPPATGAYTIETRIKVNPVAASDTNEIVFTSPSYKALLVLTWDGQIGIAQDRLSNPTKTITLDTTVYHDYRIIKHADHSYSLYIDGEFAWKAGKQTGGSPIYKFGSESQGISYMDVRYVKAATGEHVPTPSFKWNLLNDDMSNYAVTGWAEILGPDPETVTGAVYQETDSARIVDQPGTEAYLVKLTDGGNWGPPAGAYTLEARAKVNGTSTGSEITLGNGTGRVHLYLRHDGTTGTVQNKLTAPEKLYTLDTSVYHDYRLMVHDDSTYDLYIDGYLVWENVPKDDTNGNMLKIGGGNPAAGILEVDHMKIGSGEWSPVPQATIPPQGGSEYVTVKHSFLTKLDDNLSNYDELWDASAPGVVTQNADDITIKNGTIKLSGVTHTTTPPRAFTLQFRARMNQPGSVSEFRLEHALKDYDSTTVVFYLKHGTEATIQEKLNDPDYKFDLDTTKYNTYTLVAHSAPKWEDNQNYDLYVDDGENVYQIWKNHKIHNANISGGGKSYLRIGAASGNTTDMDLDHVKLVYDLELIPDSYIPAPEPEEKPVPIYKGTWANYEAERATLTGTSNIVDGEASNGNSVGGFNTAVGNGVTFQDVRAGNELSIAYSAENSGTISLYVDGVKHSALALEATGGPKIYKEKILHMDIAQGADITIQYDSGDAPIRLDAIRTYYIYDAEGAELAGGAAVYADSFADGGSAVSLAAAGNKVTFNNVMASDEVAIGYSAAADGKISVYVNGEHAKEIFYMKDELDLHREGTGKLTGDRAYNEQSVYMDIPEGAALTFQFDSGDTATNLDYIKLHPKPVFTPEQRAIKDGMITGAYVGNSATNPALFDEFLYGEGADKHIAVLAYYGQASWVDFDGGGWQFGSYWNQNPNDVLMSIPIIPEDTDKANPINSNLSDAAKGVYNVHYLKAASTIYNNMKNKTDEIHIRVGWEFNGNWYPFTIDPTETGELQGARTQDYIGAFRQVVESFRSVSDTFRFEWAPNIGPGNSEPDKAYPGDDYVDIIGLDVYDETKWTAISDPVERFQYTINRPFGLKWHRDFAMLHGKRMAYSEWGIGGNSSGDAVYIVEAMYKWFISNNVALQSYWNGGSSSGYNGEIMGGQWPNAGAKYVELFGNYTVPTGEEDVPGNVIQTVTYPAPHQGSGFGGVTVTTRPAEFQGLALDPDGNDRIDAVQVTVLRKSDNRYINVVNGQTDSDKIYNDAVYNASTGYWTLDVANARLENGDYLITSYTDDGTTDIAQNVPGTSEFKLNAPPLPPVTQAAELSGPSSVEAGGNLALTYSLVNVESEVYAKSLTVLYDPELLEFIDADELVTGFQVVGELESEGKIRLLEASTSKSPVTGSVDLLTLHFRALTPDQTVATSLSLSDVIVADASGNETALTTGTAYQVEITVVPADKTALNAKIAEAQALAVKAALQTHETLWGHYKASSVQALNDAISAASAVAGSTADQAAVDAAVAALDQALTTFLGSADTTASVGDLATMAAHYGITTASSDWVSVEMYDVKADGVLDIFDLAEIATLILQ